MMAFASTMSFKKKQRAADQSGGGVTASKSPRDRHSDHLLAASTIGSSFKKLSFVMGAAVACFSLFLLLLLFANLPCRPTQRPPAAISRLAGDHQPSDRSLKPLTPREGDSSLTHIVFGIAASARLWERRKEYVRSWWRRDKMRGFIWLDQPLNQSSSYAPDLPPIRISADISQFNYTNKRGNKSAIRIARIVGETVRIGLPDVHWFVMGDDDTVFFLENLVKVLSKYDWTKFYYIGSISESHTQNVLFSYNMAYGGGGFAISYPLAEALERIQDKCIQRYPYLFGSDNRVQACMAELGVPLTREGGFHQLDIYGDAFGLLAAHPIAPLVSLHHLDLIAPVFPNMTRLQAIQRLIRSGQKDPIGLLQQSICYDEWRNWSYSISWGYAIQVHRGWLPPRELERPSRTFLSWYKKPEEFGYPFSTRPTAVSSCEQPVVFYIEHIRYRKDGQIEGNYTREPRRRGKCTWKMASPAGLNSITVIKEPIDEHWYQAPRRQCCKILKAERSNTEIRVASCRKDEVA